MMIRQFWIGLSQGLSRALGGLLSVLLICLTLLAVAETFLWALFQQSYAALPEIQGILLVWFGLLGAAYGVQEGLHMGVDFLARRLSPALALWFWRLAQGLVALFGALLALHGAALVANLVNTLPGTGLPAAVEYWPTVVAGILIAIFSVAGVLSGAADLGIAEEVEEDV
jgi:TRAP-type C4-dicarboxylate transport system permease small subunit